MLEEKTRLPNAMQKKQSGLGRPLFKPGTVEHLPIVPANPSLSSGVAPCYPQPMNEPHSSPAIDVLTQVSHKLIRTACRDDFDPFMLGTEPDHTGPIVRACFYYAVVVTPKHTVVFDNQGQGGMCKMVPDEVAAVWDTQELLASQGVSIEDLSRTNLDVGDHPVPAPLEIHNDFPDLAEEVPLKGSIEDLPVSPQFAGRIGLMDLLKKDLDLVHFMFGPSPSPETSPSQESATSPRRPRMG